MSPWLLGLVRRRTCSVRRPRSFPSSSWMKSSVLLWHDSKILCSFLALSLSVAISRRASRFTSSGISASCGVRPPRPLPAQLLLRLTTMAKVNSGVGGRGWWAAAVAALLLVLLCAEAEPLPETCHLPKVVGRCRAAFQRWWYNATSQTCQRFIYGGCRGNFNNFLSEQDCLQECATGGDVEATASPSWPAGETMMSTTKDTSKSGQRHEPGDNRVGFKEFCAAPRVVGPCRASFPRWYFDIETRTCKTFIYGGCGGNKNNYIFEEHCLNQCTGDGEITDEPLEPNTPVHHFPDPLIHSTRAVVLSVLLAIMAAILLGSLVVFFVKICRRNQELALGTVWSTLDDKEYLMSNAYTL